MIEKVYAVFFSPTGNTRKIVETMAHAVAGMLNIPYDTVDFTLPGFREGNLHFRENDFVVLGTPTYAGRVPNKLMPFIRDSIHAEGAHGLAVVTYGNRNYDDSLMELFTLMEENGFFMTGACAVPTEHVFDARLAAGRPTEADLSAAADYARMVTGRNARLQRNDLPGHDPVGPYYVPKGRDGQPAVFLKAKPLTDPSKCIGCGLCAQVCPMGNFSPENVTEAKGACIKCQACIKACPRQAKSIEHEAFLSHVDMLVEHFADREAETIFI